MKNNDIIIGKDINEISLEMLILFNDIYTENNGKIKVAFSGGNTPKVFFEKLSELDISWENVEIFLVDERNVPHTSKDSNFNLLTKTLLNKIRIPRKNVHSIEYHADIKDSMKFFKDDLIKSFELKKDGMPEFDFIFLGLGDDGHTASLFPETYDETSNDIVTNVTGLARVQFDRISLGMNVINNAKCVAFLVSGESKTDISREVFLRQNEKYPASHVNPKARFYLFIDGPASSKI